MWGESLEGRTLGGSASAAGISSHGDSLLVLLNVLEESNSALKLPAVDGLGGLASVLEGHSEVGTAGAGRLRGLNLGGSVSNLCCEEKSQSAVACSQNIPITRRKDAASTQHENSPSTT